MKIMLLIFGLVFSNTIKSQTFLDSYREFRLEQIKSLKKKEREKWSRIFLNEITQLDTIFSSYKKRKGFDFNNADSLKIIFQTSIESSLSDVIIWSNSDSISYSEYWVDGIPLLKNKRIEYNSFLDTTWYSAGFKNFGDRDSLMLLVDKHAFETAKKMSEENPVFDGQSSLIIIAEKINGQYYIRKYFLRAFGFAPIFRKR